MEKFEAVDENGKKIIFELIETFGMNESEYAVLNSEDDINTYILKIAHDEHGNMSLEGIDDDELSDAIEVYEDLKANKEDNNGFKSDEKIIGR